MLVDQQEYTTAPYGCNLEDMSKAMDDRDEWRQRQRDRERKRERERESEDGEIRASSMT